MYRACDFFRVVTAWDGLARVHQAQKHLRIRCAPDLSLWLVARHLRASLRIKRIADLVGQRATTHHNYRYVCVHRGFYISHRLLLVVSDDNRDHLAWWCNRPSHSANAPLGNPLNQIILAAALISPFKFSANLVISNHKEVSVAVRQLIILSI